MKSKQTGEQDLGSEEPPTQLPIWMPTCTYVKVTHFEPTMIWQHQLL